MSKVDIVLPVREPAPWFSECMASIEHCMSHNVHLIISLHGSSLPNEVAIAQVTNLSVVYSPASATLSDVLNAGIAEGTSPFISRIDADDLMSKDRLHRQLVALEENADLVGVGSDAVEINESGQPVGYRKGSGDCAQTLRSLAWRNPIIHPSMTFRRSVFDRVGGYDSRAFLAEDYDLWLRMSSLGNIMSLEAPLIQYRIHTQQTSRRSLVSKEARRRVRQSRRNLAHVRGKSKFFADFQHAAWSAYHIVGRNRPGH